MKKITLILSLILIIALCSCTAKEKDENGNIAISKDLTITVTYSYQDTTYIVLENQGDSPITDCDLTYIAFDQKGFVINYEAENSKTETISAINLLPNEKHLCSISTKDAVYAKAVVSSITYKDGTTWELKKIDQWVKNEKSDFDVEKYESDLELLQKKSRNAENNDYIEFLGYSISEGESLISNQTLTVGYNNISSKNIVKVKGYVLQYNKNGEPVSASNSSITPNGKYLDAECELTAEGMEKINCYTVLNSLNPDTGRIKFIIINIEFSDGTSWSNPWAYEWIFSNFLNDTGHLEKSVFNERALEIYDELLSKNEYLLLLNLSNTLEYIDIILKNDSNAEIFEYAKGLQDMENELYGEAIEHFEKTDYKDSEELKNELLNSVSKFNGTYYYDKWNYPGTGCYIYIKNGRVSINIRDTEDKNDPVYYTDTLVENILGWYISNVPFSGPAEVEDYQYRFFETEDGQYLLSGYNGNDTFDGVYTKISDTYPDEE